MSRTAISQRANATDQYEPSSKTGTSGTDVLIDARPQASVQRQVQRMADGSPDTSFVDNRPAAIIQRQLREIADSAAQIRDKEAAIGFSEQVSQCAGAMPGKLRQGIESLSGMSMEHVSVHYNSSKPAQLQAAAYAQGSDIHLAPGQEHHLPHEAWHVVQQMQGRVAPTMQAKGAPINDDESLEREADRMGAQASEWSN